MYSVINKMAVTAAISLLMCAGCSGGGSRNQIDSGRLLDDAHAQIVGGNPRKALELLDSLDRTYNDVPEAIKKSMRMRPEAIEALAVINIAETDSLIAKMSHRLDSIAPLMKKINLPQTEGYFVATEGYDPSFMNKTGISARVSEIGQFYLVSSVNPSSGINHWSVSALSGEMTATTDTVPYDGILNYRINNSELISFSPTQSDTVGHFIYLNRSCPIYLSFNGQNGKSRRIKLSSKQTEAIATAYDYALLINSLRTLTIEREKFEKQIQLARQQTARLEQPQSGKDSD